MVDEKKEGSDVDAERQWEEPLIRANSKRLEAQERARLGLPPEHQENVHSLGSILTMIEKMRDAEIEREKREGPRKIDPPPPAPEYVSPFDQRLPGFVRRLAIGSEELLGRVERKLAIEEAKRAAEAKEQKVVFVGVSGTGKTSLAAAALRHRVSLPDARISGRDIRFIDARRFATARLRHSLGEGEPAEVEAAMQANILVIDDLGQDTPPTQLASSPIPDVVFERYQWQRPTWVTTWLDLEEMSRRYGDGFARRVLEDAAIIQCGHVAAKMGDR